MIEIRLNQGVWNIREKESTRPALLYGYIHALQTVLNSVKSRSMEYKGEGIDPARPTI